jgi:hypothetical protein
MATMKKVTIQAFLPQLPAAHAYQESRGSGGSLAVAIKRAVDELMAKEIVKGKRLHSMKLVVAVVE